MPTNLLPLAAVMTSLTVAAVLIAVAATPIYLKAYGTFSTKQHVTYIAGTATIATIITGFIASQVRALLLRRIDSKLQSISNTDRLNRYWRVTLNIGNLKESFRYPLVELVFSLTSLITTVIVTGLTPDLTTRRSSYSPKISYGPNRCCRTQPLSDVELDGREYYWDLGNGSAFFIPANAGGCPTRFATVLAGNVNSVNPDVFAYADGGVEVPGSAVGTPISIYSSQPNVAPDLSSLLVTYGRSVVSTTQCVPVMRQNPITCRRGGTITLGSSQMNLTSSDGKCEHEAQILSYSPLTDNTMASVMCAHGEVGQGTIIMGASGSYVKWLASFLGDHDYPHPTDEGDMGNGGDWAGYSYVVTCTVDARDVWEYRTVTLTLQNPDASDPTYARSLGGHELCYPSPGTSAINECLVGTSAAANWQILDQNSGQDGLLDLLGDLTDNWRPPPYGFNNSKNALEDALGLISALVASRISSFTVAVNGTVVITATTIGSRKAFAYAFIIPPVAVAFVLLSLIATTRTLEDDFLSSANMDHLIQMGIIREVKRREETERQPQRARQQTTETASQQITKTASQQTTETASQQTTETASQQTTEIASQQATETVLETGREAEMGLWRNMESDQQNLLQFAAPHGQSRDEAQDQ